MSKRLLILGGGREAYQGIKYLKAEYGLELVVCDSDVCAPGFELADHCLVGSVYHLENCLPEILKFHNKYPLDGVMCIACDATNIVARIAQILGLPGLPIEVADRTVNKLGMKDKLSEDNLPIPAYTKVNSPFDLKEKAHRWKLVVVKPIDSRGSKGVSIFSHDQDPNWAFDYAMSHSKGKQVMLERFLPGPQISTESVVIDGKVVTPAISDRCYDFFDKYSPFIVENGGDMPSFLRPQLKNKIEVLLESSIRSLGLNNCIVKGDIVVHEGIPHIIELAGRLSGGYFCTHQIPFSTGINLVGAAAMLCLGEKLNPSDWEPKHSKPVSSRWLLSDKQGYVKSFEDPLILQKSAGTLAFETWIEQGQKIELTTFPAVSVAMVQATGSDRLQATLNAKNALNSFALKLID